jgi:hypothetical protein
LVRSPAIRRYKASFLSLAPGKPAAPSAIIRPVAPAAGLHPIANPGRNDDHRSLAGKAIRQDDRDQDDPETDKWQQMD